jgi:single-stranded DNA-binding protein
VVVFGTLAERTVGSLHTGDPVIAQGEFRFRAYEDNGGNTRTGTSFVASRLGPDILLADVTVTRRAREAETARTREVAQEAAPPSQPSPGTDWTEQGLAKAWRPQRDADAAPAPAPTM